MISGSSVFCALIAFTIALVLICLLRLWTGFLKIGGITILMLAFLLASLRLLAPLELPFTYTVRSWNILGKVLDLFLTYSTVTRILLIIWIVGAAVVMVKYVVDMYNFRDWCSRYIPAKNEFVQKTARELGITCPVVVTRDVQSPYVVGILHHTIYFPSKEIPEKWVDYALSHEKQHIQRHHAVVKFFFGLVSAAMWWNPIVHWGRRNVDALLELRCDQVVTAGMDEQERMEYGKMLSAFAQDSVSSRKIPALALVESPMVGKEDRFLKQRLDVVMRRNDKPAWIVTIASLFVLIAVFFASYSVLYQPAGAPSDGYFQNDHEYSYREHYDGPDIGSDTAGTFIVEGSDGRYQLFLNYTFSRYLTEDEVASDQYKNLLRVKENRQR